MPCNESNDSDDHITDFNMTVNDSCIMEMTCANMDHTIYLDDDQQYEDENKRYFRKQI